MATNLTILLGYACDLNPHTSYFDMEDAVIEVSGRYGVPPTDFTNAMEDEAVALAAELRDAEESEWGDNS